MRNILLAPLWLAAAVAAIVIVPVIILGMLVLGLIAWVCGVPITIKHTTEGGERVVGHVRWFTYHPDPDYVINKTVDRYLKKIQHDRR